MVRAIGQPLSPPCVPAGNAARADDPTRYVLHREMSALFEAGGPGHRGSALLNVAARGASPCDERNRLHACRASRAGRIGTGVNGQVATAEGDTEDSDPAGRVVAGHREKAGKQARCRLPACHADSSEGKGQVTAPWRAGEFPSAHAFRGEAADRSSTFWCSALALGPPFILVTAPSTFLGTTTLLARRQADLRCNGVDPVIYVAMLTGVLASPSASFW